MSVRLPLFPLDVVLFPGVPLPLHIFEPRYRRLIDDCLEPEAPFGIIRLGRTTEAPAPGTIGCTARIRAHHQLPDGRSNIVVVGETRFLLQHYLDEHHPYLVAMVEEFEDREGEPTPPGIEQLQQVFRDIVDAMHRLHDTPSESYVLPEDPAALTFQIAAMVDLDAAYKLRVLELRSTTERVDLLTQLLPDLARTLERRSRIHMRARLNGRGDRHPPPPRPNEAAT